MSSRYDRTLYSIVFSQPAAVKVIDFDIDGKIDFMVGGRDEGWIILGNNSSPGFIDFPDMYTRNTPNDDAICDLAVGDLNFDGYPDVAMDYVQTYWSPNGDYAIIASNIYHVNENMIIPEYNSMSASMGGYSYAGFGVDIADLDLDGKPDIIKQHSTDVHV